MPYPLHISSWVSKELFHHIVVVTGEANALEACWGFTEEVSNYLRRSGAAVNIVAKHDYDFRTLHVRTVGDYAPLSR